MVTGMDDWDGGGAERGRESQAVGEKLVSTSIVRCSYGADNELLILIVEVFQSIHTVRNFRRRLK